MITTTDPGGLVSNNCYINKTRKYIKKTDQQQQLGLKMSIEGGKLLKIWFPYISSSYLTQTIISFVILDCQASKLYHPRIKSFLSSLLKTFLLDSIFEPLNYLKLGPIFVGPTLSILKIQHFHLTTVDFWAKTLHFRTHQGRNSMT